MKIAIEYQNIGRSKFGDTIEYNVSDELSADDVAWIAFAEARKHLVSVGVETAYDADKNEGSVFAGFHSVGKFKLAKGKVTLEKVMRRTGDKR